MDKYTIGISLAILVLLLGAFALVLGTQYIIGSATRITDNKTITGVFEKIEIKGSDATIYFKDYSSVTFYQSGGFYGSGGNSLQVPFIVGHTYQLIFAIHGTGLVAETYMTLQSVVEIPT
jgi:hypothetical protein